MKYITIKDIAAQLGMSKSTVSRALAGDHNVSPETRDRVKALAEELGYKRNEMAANLRKNYTRTVGIIVPEMTTPFFLNIIITIQEILNKHGFKVIITQSHEDPEAELYNLQLLDYYRVDGIIMSICHKDKNLKEYLKLEKKGIPIVFFDRVPSKMYATKVVVDDYMKSFFMMEHLIRSGRRKIVHLAGPDRIPNTAERKRAYVDALAKFKIPYDPAMVIEGENDREAGKQVIAKFLHQKIPFDAIFCFGETLAIGAMGYMQRQGIRVPEDVAVAGFSGTYLGTLVTPQLTTIEQPFIEMGKVAAKLMIEKLNEPESEVRTVTLEANILVRQST